MAKREAPEINAGSMADIAFLLLIFFLVTTTMDKDVAYIRTIPKKVETDVKPPPIQEKNVYSIKINAKQLIQAKPLSFKSGDSIIGPDEIEALNRKIKHFYTINRDKKENRNINYPYYAFGTKEDYTARMVDAMDRLDIYEAQDPEENPQIDKYIEQALNEIAEWKKKLDIIKLYTSASGKREMPELAPQAHIRLESFIDTDYSAYVAVQSEVEKAVTELRDKESKEIFDISYTNMKTYWEQKKLEDSPKIREYREKMDLIESLYPLRLIEVKPKN
jgi:biopolymer transport protein ExbD